jgi:YfiH family protein
MQILQSPELAAIPGVGHAFFTRQGGVSNGIYASLNCGPGSDDDAVKVTANRATAMGWLKLPAAALCTLHQVHGREVITVNSPNLLERRPKADGMVTAAAGLALGILTADCAPVLFADLHRAVIGACHAGWRGALAGVTDATVEAMERLGAHRDAIVAAIGPAIGPTSYEVGPEFPGRFLEQSPANELFFSPSRRPGHIMFDLVGYLRARLGSFGVAHVSAVERDTFAEPEVFFSYRRSMLVGEHDYGRQLSAIALVPRA